MLKDGQISEMGSYEELLSHDGPFSAFLKTYLTEEVGSEEEEDPEGNQGRGGGDGHRRQRG